MVADDTAESGYRSQEEKELDLKLPACEDSVGHEDGVIDMAVCASEGLSPTDGPLEEAKEPKKWKWAVIFLCFYGFMSALKPGEPFITPNLLSPEKNFTREQVSVTLRVKSVVFALIYFVSTRENNSQHNHIMIILLLPTNKNKIIKIASVSVVQILRSGFIHKQKLSFSLYS